MSDKINIDLEDIKNKLVDKIRPSGWADKLKGFILSSDFDQILLSLYTRREEGKRFTPPLKYVFRAFEECPWNDIKAVIIGQDPYPTIDVADGVAFSCSRTSKPQPSLRYIFDAMTSDGIEHDSNPDLTRWAQQGVLLLNTSLTCEIDKPGSHKELWSNFTAYALDIINSYNRGIVFVLMGKEAAGLIDLIGEQHHVIVTKHPASAAYNGGKWDSEECFDEINRILMEQTKDTIKW